MKVLNPGTGYKSPPFVEITDTCKKGYGAVARSVIDYDPSSPTYQQVTDVYVVSAGENYPVIEQDEDDEGVYTVDHVVVVKTGKNYTQDDVVVDDKGNVYEKFLDEQGRFLNVIPPDPSMNDLEPFDTLPELEVISSTGTGAFLKAQLAPRPTYQGKVRQVIDCISPRNAGIVGFVNGEPYYGAFHIMPNGTKMTGVKHTGNDMIIYDTPQESRTSRGMTMTTTPIQTVASEGQVTYTPTETPTPTTETTTMTDSTGDGTINYDSTTPSPPSSGSSTPPSPPPSSPPPSSGGGYGGGY